MPLSEEMYQRIHIVALHRAIQGYAPSTLPKHIQIEHLRQQVQRKGRDICLLHHADLLTVFAGVTFALYKAIETLYCSRIGRSISMVWRLLKAMARDVHVPPVSYEAVWAICLYLEKQRHASVDISIERGQECWHIGKIPLDFVIQESGGAATRQPCIICVLDKEHQRVLSFRLASQETESQCLSLALYDALRSQRRPHAKALAGVLWRLPKHIVTEVPLPSDGQFACKKLGIALATQLSPYPLLLALQTTWATNLTERVLRSDQCALLLDRYLEKTFGHGPLRTQEEHEQKYAHLVGYPQEPESLFPLLRAFLPQHPGHITYEGEIEYDHLHYVHDLLAYFVDAPVIVRQSASTEAQLWVYLGQEVLCQAMARELQRRDGTYRRSRPGR